MFLYADCFGRPTSELFLLSKWYLVVISRPCSNTVLACSCKLVGESLTRASAGMDRPHRPITLKIYEAHLGGAKGSMALEQALMMGVYWSFALMQASQVQKSVSIRFLANCCLNHNLLVCC